MARPANCMTHRRRQVLDEIMDAAAHGERVTLSSLMRKCGLYDRSHASRIVKDLRKMGAI